MNKLLLLSVAALWMLPSLEAQEAAPSTPAAAPGSQAPAVAAAKPDDRLELIPGQSPQPGNDPVPLIPESPTPTGKRKENRPIKEKKSETEQATEKMGDRVRFRLAQNKAVNDPAVQAQFERIHLMRTDSERRTEWKAYYKLLFAKMNRLDGSLKAQIELAERKAVDRVTQKRLTPSEELLEVNRTQITD